MLSIIMDCYHLQSVIIDHSVTHPFTKSRTPLITSKRSMVK